MSMLARLARCSSWSITSTTSVGQVEGPQFQLQRAAFDLGDDVEVINQTGHAVDVFFAALMRNFRLWSGSSRAPSSKVKM